MPVCNCPPSPFDSRPDPAWPVPDDDACALLWTRYNVPEHIQGHSRTVAEMATAIATAAVDNQGPDFQASVSIIRASALLHDLAKAYTIEFGGNHSQIGACWVAEETRNPLIAQGVLHHVIWGGELDPGRFFVPLTVLYADKRARHEELVTVGERFEDLIARYGRTKEIRDSIRENWKQTIDLERRLSALLGVDLGAHTARGRRLVPGT